MTYDAYATLRDMLLNLHEPWADEMAANLLIKIREEENHPMSELTRESIWARIYAIPEVALMKDAYRVAILANLRRESPETVRIERDYLHLVESVMTRRGTRLLERKDGHP